jgi:hypothetical protein
MPEQFLGVFMQKPAVALMFRRELDFRPGCLGKKENDDFEIFLALALIYVFIATSRKAA